MSAATRSRCRASSPARQQASPSSIRSRFRRGAARRGGTDEWSAAVLTFENGIIAAGLVRGLRQARQCAAHPRQRRAASRCRISGSPAAAATRASARSTSSRATASARRSASNATPHLYSFEVDAAAEAIRAGRQEFSAARHDLGRQPRQCPRARPVARRRPGSNTRSRSRHARTLTLAGRKLKARRRRSPSVRSPACRKKLSRRRAGL